MTFGIELPDFSYSAFTILSPLLELSVAPDPQNPWQVFGSLRWAHDIHQSLHEALHLGVQGTPMDSGNRMDSVDPLRAHLGVQGGSFVVPSQSLPSDGFFRRCGGPKKERGERNNASQARHLSP